MTTEAKALTESATTSAPPPFDINEVTVRGITVALHNAVARWEIAGAPYPSESGRQAIRDYIASMPESNQADVSQKHNIYEALARHTADAEFARAQAEKMAALARSRATRREAIEVIRTEAKNLRKTAGMTMKQMASVLPGVNLQKVINFEAGLYTVEKSREMLDLYKAVTRTSRTGSVT